VADVARRAGIQNADLAIDTTTLETEEEIREAATKYTVFGRVTPEMKKALIRALRKNGHTVAMTGDGVNDVLAMREANCAVAMAGGAQAATQVAQLVLTESDFSRMPGIVAEGRRVVNNIQRAATLFLVKNIFSLGLALINIFAGLAYPVIPIHMTLISALTIGTPSFFLALEPNYQRFSGHFLRGVLRRAFPGGLTNIFVVLAAQAFMPVFGLELPQIGTVSAGILGAVGLLVLWQACRPFDLWRRIIWIAMAVALVGSFLFLGGFFQLQLGDTRTLLALGTLLLMTPTVFFGMQWVFDMGERLILRFREKK
jgi:cation-transporting ATPase E